MDSVVNNNNNLAGLPDGSQIQTAPKEKTVNLEIFEGSSHACFFVTGVNGDESIKTILRDLNGHYNTRMKGWRFPRKNYEEVCKQLNIKPTIKLSAPGKVITVTLQQKFQWPHDMSMANQKLKEIGLKKRTGKTNDWSGELTDVQVAKFFDVFNIKNK